MKDIIYILLFIILLDRLLIERNKYKIHISIIDKYFSIWVVKRRCNDIEYFRYKKF